MSHEEGEASPWDDVLSSNHNSTFAGLDNHIVSELSTTFAQSDIRDNDEEEEDPHQEAQEDTEQEAVTNGDSDHEDQPQIEDSLQKTPTQDTSDVHHTKKDAAEILSSILPKDSESSTFIKETVASPKKGESLFKESSSNNNNLPTPKDHDEDDEGDNDKDNTVKTSIHSSPTKLRRQNIYKAPRQRRVPLKLQKKPDDSDALEASGATEPLGPLGTTKEVAAEQETESAAERLLKQSETPLFQINRTPLSPLKSNQTKQVNDKQPPAAPSFTKPVDEDLKLEQAKLDQKATNEPSIKLDITVGDPVRVGDITSAHIVYSVRTKTDSDLFNAPQTVVSRRYRDFRWLYRQLQATHPGRIIPPPPDKQAVGRFNENFIEGRRFALERMLVKISENAHLQTDPDFIMFLQSERFSSEAREREKIVSTTSIFTDDKDASLNNNSGGLLSSLGGAFSFSPKVTEPDTYFRDKRGYIESMDQQLKLFLRNLETVVLQRHDLSAVTEEFSNVISTLADLEISKSATELFHEFATTQLRIKELLDRLSLQDMLTLGSTLDEYQRVIGSIKNTFQQREKVLLLISTSEHDLTKKQASLDKYIKYNSTQTDKIESLKSEVAALEQKHLSIKEKYESISKTIKEELATFEVEKIHDFRNSIEIYLESTIESQKEAVELWETFYTNNIDAATAS